MIATTENNVHETLPPLKAEARNLNFYYGDFQALKNINMPIYEKKVTSLIGPSGCGKSTYLRCFNRMHDLYPGNRYEGAIDFHPDRTDLLSKKVDPIEVRMRISMVFQKPNPFPKSIYENVAYGLRVRGENARSVIDDKVEAALRGEQLQPILSSVLRQVVPPRRPRPRRPGSPAPSCRPCSCWLPRASASWRREMPRSMRSMAMRL